MTETLSTSSMIVVFGRVVEDLAIMGGDSASGEGAMTALTGQQAATGGKKKAPGKPSRKFARIYGFSYDGAYFETLTPTLFLVRGDGVPAADAPVPGPNPRDKAFFESLRAWTVDRTDETVRLDVDSGKYENVLLDMIGDGGTGVSGARVSGARVSGARVSGARVSGARVSGARISGARGDASD